MAYSKGKGYGKGKQSEYLDYCVSRVDPADNGMRTQKTLVATKWPTKPSENKQRFVEAFLLSQFTYENVSGLSGAALFGSVFCPEFSTNMSNMLDELPFLP